MRVLFAGEWRESNNRISEMALRMECEAIVLCGNLGLETTHLEVAAWVKQRDPVRVFVVPGPEDSEMPIPENISGTIKRWRHFEFSGIDCIPDDGRPNKRRCRRDDEYFSFPPQCDAVPDAWPEQAREMPTISKMLAELPAPQTFRSSIYVLPAPYGATFCSELAGEPCPTCGHPHEPYVPINGSRAVRRFIEERQPLLTVHPGTEWSEKRISRTKCILLGDEPVIYDMFNLERLV